MNSSPIYRLVLYPADLGYAPESWEKIHQRLKEAEVIDVPYGKVAENRFLVGDKFLQYVTFLGCSPHLELAPLAVGALDFCHFQFSTINADVQFRCAAQNVFARCPDCKKRLTNWQHAVSSWCNDWQATTFQCNKCNTEISLYDLGWRHTAGFARLFIDIYSIFPQEGIPTEQLLTLLEQASGVQWDYFYSDQK